MADVYPIMDGRNKRAAAPKGRQGAPL